MNKVPIFFALFVSSPSLLQTFFLHSVCSVIDTPFPWLCKQFRGHVDSVGKTTHFLTSPNSHIIILLLIKQRCRSNYEQFMNFHWKRSLNCPVCIFSQLPNVHFFYSWANYTLLQLYELQLFTATQSTPFYCFACEQRNRKEKTKVNSFLFQSKDFESFPCCIISCFKRVWAKLKTNWKKFRTILSTTLKI